MGRRLSLANMRVLVSCSIGGAGHFNPLRPFIDALRKSDDDVLLVIPPALESVVASRGYPFRVGGEPPPEAVSAIREAISTASRADAAFLSEHELFGRLCTGAMLPAMAAAFESWKPELVLREPCEYAAAVVARQHGIPQAQVAVSQARIEISALDLAAPALESYDGGVVEELRSSPYLTRLPASMDPQCYSDTRRFREEVRASYERLPKWWDNEAMPLVYLTFGSIAGSMHLAAEAYRTALDAVSDLEVRVLLTVGHRIDIAELGTIPTNVHVEAWVPQDEVFGHASLVVCHGGSGTTFGALAAGLPLVIVPLFADQFPNARRVAEAGAGIAVEPASPEGSERASMRPEDAARMGDAIVTVLHEPSYSAAAARISLEMHSLPSVEELVAGLKIGGNPLRHCLDT
jgi:UDP:flavonoid glycosyltransferase YjiC (YdhE family)